MKPQDASRFGPLPTVLRNGQTVAIRLLTTADGEALAEFYAAIPPEDTVFYLPHPLDRKNAMWNAAEADAPFRVYLVAEAGDGRIAGYAWYRWKNEQALASQFGICLRRGYQDAGLGRALMDRLMTIAAEVGPPTMFLTVLKANPRAAALYQKMGFRIVREQLRKTDNEPEYFMERARR